MTPESYLKSLDSKKHLVLIYDDESAGRKIEFDFIQKGLEKKLKKTFFYLWSPFQPKILPIDSAVSRLRAIFIIPSCATIFIGAESKQ